MVCRQLQAEAVLRVSVIETVGYGEEVNAPLAIPAKRNEAMVCMFAPERRRGRHHDNQPDTAGPIT